jgi:hypothetical protein
MRHISMKRRIRLPRRAMVGLSATAAATALALTLSGHALPPPATADPNSGTWDPAKYDNCVRSYPVGQNLDRWLNQCCVQSGGIWREDLPQPSPPANYGARCVAPPPGSASPTRQVPSGIGEETLTPQRPRPIPVPPNIGSETFTETPVPTPYPTPTTSTTVMAPPGH